MAASAAAILILRTCHGGCDGGWANARVVSRLCQEGKTRKMVIARRCSKNRLLAPAILILRTCHGGCDGGWANARVVSRLCQEGKTRKMVIARRCSKNRLLAPALLTA